ncbi:hypothetical protein ACFL1W_01200, partial [Candidatus Margulisiibacteriota bacterium]
TQCGKVSEGPTTTTTTATITTTTTTTTTIPSFSISGTVNFVTTSDGIRGGVDITVTESSAVVDSTSAEATSGTYEVSGLDAGTYTLIASKDGWTIPTIEVVISSADLSDQDLTAEPTSWEVLRVGGGEVLKDACSMEVLQAFRGDMFAIGSGSSVLLSAEAAAPTSWSAWPSPTTEALVETREWADSWLYVIDRLATAYRNNSSGWTSIGAFTNEAVAALDLGTNFTWEAVTEAGKLIRSEDQGVSYTDISPSGKFVRDVRLLDGEDDECVAVGDGGYVGHRYSDSWLNRTSDITEDLTGIEIWDIGGSEKTMVVSTNGTIYVTTDTKFEHFTADLSGIPYALNGVRGMDMKHAVFPSGAVVVGNNGLIMRRK